MLMQEKYLKNCVKVLEYVQGGLNMKKMIEEVRNKLEKEKSHSKRFLLSALYCSLYPSLSAKEQALEAEHIEEIDFILSFERIYDYLREDADIFEEFANKIENRFEETEFTYYDLYPQNKLNYDEARHITFDILENMGIENISNLYTFDKIRYQDLDEAAGYCINTFGLFDGNIFLDKNIDKMVIFIQSLLHEIGHNYENLFMSNMSSHQQIERYNYGFIEVISSFFERIALEYLIENRIYMDDANRVLNAYYFDLYDRLTLLGSFVKDNNFEYAKYDSENILFPDINVDEDTENDWPQNFYKYNYANFIKYGYGALLGEYFFDIYRKDKKEGLKSIKKFLSNQALLDERDMFDSIDFRDNDFSFLDKGLLENKNYMRKRYKW